ncbi:MAG TPA: delta-60 repeat domain-containing protein, partial [Pseudomonadales bacterium]|nr:delta-60 repeat domain-containing protein [Pseudomonadales bacterium]
MTRFSAFVLTRLLPVLLALLFAARAVAAAGDIDTAFNTGTGANNTVFAVAAQPDGRVVVGGDFTTINGVARNRIARMNADGSLDTGFNTGTGANNSVTAIVVQADGKVVVGGSFTTINGVARNRIARLNADGSLDTGFNPGAGANATVAAVALQPDGKILVGATVSSGNGLVRKTVARLNADGSLDTSFNIGVVSGVSGAYIKAMAIQPDGKVVIGGDFISINGVPRNSIARLNLDGSLDIGFIAGVNGSVNAVVVQPDGKVMVGGGFTTVNGVSRTRIARLNTDGSVDAGFLGTGASWYVNALLLQPDGKLVIGGAFTSFNGYPRNYIARTNADGSIDTGFNPGMGAGNYVNAIATQTDGRVILGGYFTTYSGVSANRMVRIHTGDADVDGVEDAADAFPTNPAAATDSDHDSLPDAWLQPNAFGCVMDAAACNGLVLDDNVDAIDSDGVPAATDNCPYLYNLDQPDGDHDGI